MREPTEPSLADLCLQVRVHGLHSATGREAAGAIIQRIGGEVRALCLRKARTPDQADELFQEVFKRLLTQFEGSGELPRDLGAYVRGIVWKVYGETLKSKRPPGRADVEELTSGDYTEEERLIRRIDLLRLLSSLPNRMRHVVIGTYLKDRPTQEIATELGISVENVRQLRVRALRLLEKSRPDLKRLRG